MKELIDRFLMCWKPFASLFPANSCIEQTRILYECLHEDVLVNPVETRLVVRCGDLSLAYMAGSTAAEREQALANKPAGEVIDMHRPGSPDMGHVVAIVGGAWLVDLTLSQASMPERGLTIERQGIAAGPLAWTPDAGSVIEAGLVLNSGFNIDVQWMLTGRRDFEQTPAWEPSHLWPLIHRLRREMKWAEVVDKAMRRQ